MTLKNVIKCTNCISESIGGMNPMSKNPMEKKQIKKSESLKKIEKKYLKNKK